MRPLPEAIARSAAIATVLLALGCHLAKAQKAAGKAEVRTSAARWAPPPLEIRAQVERVTAEVVVRREDGQVVRGLGRSSFRIKDEGHPQAVIGFAVLNAPPDTSAVGAGAAVSAPAVMDGPRRALAPAPLRSIALFFDDVNTEEKDLDHARNAARRFVSEALRPGDRVAVFTSSSHQTLDFTTDRAVLAAAIRGIHAHPRASVSMLPCPYITAFEAYEIAALHRPMALAAAMQDAGRCQGSTSASHLTLGSVSSMSLWQRNAQESLLAEANATWEQARAISSRTLAQVGNIVAFLARQPGQRVLLMASQGFLSETLEAQQDAIISVALHAGVVINALDAKALFSEPMGAPLGQAAGVQGLISFLYAETSKFPMRQAQDAAMVNLARSTGGLFFHNNNDLTLGFKRLGLTPEVAYQLAFVPPAHDGRFHRLKISVIPSQHYLLQYRPGYFAPGADHTADLQSQMDAAMRATDSESGLPVTVDPRPAAGHLTVAMRLDASRLPFQKKKGRHALTLHFIAGLFDSQGQFITGKEAEMDLALKDATWGRLVAQGLNTNLTLDAPTGGYTLRVVVATGPTTLFATSTSTVIR